MKKILLLILGGLLATSHVSGAISNIEEEDGSPSAYPWKMKVTNGSLTDNSDGTVSLDVSGTTTTPGGSTTQVQYNNAGAFGGDAGLTYDDTSNELTAGGFIGGDATFNDATFNGAVGIGTTIPNATLHIKSATSSTNNLILESSDDSETKPPFLIKNSSSTNLVRINPFVPTSPTSNNEVFKINTNDTFDGIGSTYYFKIQDNGNDVFRIYKAEQAGLNVRFEILDGAGTVIAGLKSAGGLFTLSKGSNNLLRAGGENNLFTSNPFGVNARTLLSGFGGTAMFGVLVSSSTIVGAIIQGAVSQSANLQEWQDSAGNVLMEVTSSGNVAIGTTTNNGALTVKSPATSDVSFENIIAATKSSTGGPGLAISARDQEVKLSASKSSGVNPVSFLLGAIDGSGTFQDNLYLSSGGNVGVGVDTPLYKFQIAGDASFNDATFNSILPAFDDTFDLGSDTNRWRDIYLGPGSIHIGTSTSDEGKITYNTTSNVLEITGDATFGHASFTTITVDSCTGCGGGASVAGADTEVQFNDGGSAFGADSDFTYNKTSNELTAGGFIGVDATFSGNVGIGTTVPLANLDVIIPSSTDIGIKVKGASSQSANIQEWQNSSAAVLASIDSVGKLIMNQPSGGTNHLWETQLNGTPSARIRGTNAGTSSAGWLHMMNGAGIVFDAGDAPGAAHPNIVITGNRSLRFNTKEDIVLHAYDNLVTWTFQVDNNAWVTTAGFNIGNGGTLSQSHVTFDSANLELAGREEITANYNGATDKDGFFKIVDNVDTGPVTVFEVHNNARGTDNSGEDFTLRAPAGTGTGLGGKFIFKTAPASTTGSTLNTFSDALIIDGSGNVGIGPGAPNKKLHVQGEMTATDATFRNATFTNATFVDATFKGAIVIGPSTLTGRKLALRQDGNGGAAILVNTGTGNSLRVDDAASDTSPFVIDQNGNVAIGVTSTSVKLDVRGAAVFNEDGAVATFRVESDTLPNALVVNGTTNRVGINSATPRSLFDVNGNMIAGNATFSDATFTAVKANFFIPGSTTFLQTQFTTLTHTEPTTPDYAIQDFTAAMPFGFVDADEARSVLKVIKNLQERVQVLETTLENIKILQSN